MSEVASAYVTLIPSAKGFGRGIQSEIGGDLDRAGRAGGKRLGGGLSSSFLPATKAMAGAAAGLFAAAKIGGFLKDSIAEAREAQKVGALTAQVIKTTGGAAKVTAAQVGNLATAISNKTGIDDEAIQAGANLLLTFKNVRNEAGKGNDVFNQATQAAADLSAAGFGDLNGASKQLGKALNDPVKGMTALGRAGVTFTDQQKKQIKTLVASGKTLDAQKIILKEVQSQVGGAAAASATAGEKLSVAFGNFKEQIGTALLPIIDKVAGFLTEKIVPALSSFITGMQDGTGAGGAFVGFFKTVWTVVQPLASALINTVVPAVKGLFASFVAGGGPSKITALFAVLVGFFRGQVVPAVMSIVTAVRGFVAVALPIVQAFVAGMVARITPMLPTIRAIFGTIGQIIVGVMGLVQAIIQRVTTVISYIWARWGKNIMDYVSSSFRNILTVIGGALKIIQGIIKVATSIFKGDWSGAWAGIKQIVAGAWQVIKGVVSQALNTLGTIIKGSGALLGAAMSAVGDKINGALDGLRDKMLNAGKELIQNLIDGIKAKIGAVKDAAKNVAQAVKDFFPGSPVRRGPLTSWNNGGAGRRLGDQLASGLSASQSTVAAASRGLASSVAAPVGSPALAGVGGGGGSMSQADILRLAAAMGNVQLQTTVSAGSFDRQMGARL